MMSVFGNNDLFAEFQDHHEASDEEERWEEVNRWEEENEILKRENAKLRKVLRILTQPKHIRVRDPVRDGPTAHLLLFNNITSRNERQSLEDFIGNYLFRSKSTNDVMLRPQRSSLQCPTFDENRTADAERAFIITNSIQFYNSRFCLDQLGDPLRRNETMPLKVPDYDRGFPDALNGEVEKVEVNENRATRTCFNCGGKDHQLKDCPTPKNYRAISERKQKFMNMISASPQSGTVRYHADQDGNGIDPRFAVFKAGVVSQELREALGMGKRDLPPYIYQMRMLGYPPGHLEEARITGSGLSFYKGKKDEKTESSEEEGLLDTSKIIDYPGFNVDAEKHIIDGAERRGFLPMDSQHRKEVMVSYHNHRNELLNKRRAEMNEQEELARKRHKPNRTVKSRHDDVREVDMETSDVEDSGGDVIIESKESLNNTQESAKDDVLSSNDRDASEDCNASTIEETIEVEEVEEEGEVLSTSSSCVEIIEEHSLSDDFEMDEEMDELESRRNEILKKLKLADNDDSDDVIYVSASDDVTEVKDTSEKDEVVDLIELSDGCSSPPSSGRPSSHPLSDNRPVLPPDAFVKDSILGAPPNSQGTLPGPQRLKDTPDSPPSQAQTPGFTLIPQHLPESPPERAIEQSPESPQCGDSEPIAPPGVDSSCPSPVVDSGSPPDSPSVEISDTVVDSPAPPPQSDASPSLPHRSRFAQGITQFDNYYQESKSSGVYKRLRNVLKDSPKNRSKT